MKNLISTIFFFVMAHNLNAQTTERRSDSAKNDYLIVVLREVIISRTSKSYTTEATFPAIKGVQIKSSVLSAAEGYKFVLSSDGKLVSLQTANKTGTNTTLGKFECICPATSGTCKITLANGAIGCLSTGCTECAISASIDNTKYQFKFK